MQINELFPALAPVVSAFQKIGILYYIGGSISSSIHGIPRTTMDIDIIADIKQEHVEALYLSLEPGYGILAKMDRSFTSIRFMEKVVRRKKMNRSPVPSGQEGKKGTARSKINTGKSPAG
jgi:hypothetical protein